MKQIVVIGGGAAGLMAAVIAGREGGSCYSSGKDEYGGQKNGYHR